MTIEELEKQNLEMKKNLDALNASVTKLTEENKKLTDSNESLLKYNNELFMEVATSRENKPKSKDKDEDIIEIESAQEFEKKQIDDLLALMHGEKE